MSFINMASSLLKGVCRACQLSLRTLSRVNSGISVAHRGLRTALPPANEIPEEDLAEYEVSKEEFKFVERLLPPATIPPAPHHESYPTASGWVPPTETATSLPYYVRRTKNHMLPIYEEVRNGGNRKFVVIRHIDGDIWAFDKDLKNYIQEATGWNIVVSQVHELGGYIRIKGRIADNVCQFLLDKGF